MPQARVSESRGRGEQVCGQGWILRGQSATAAGPVAAPGRTPPLTPRQSGTTFFGTFALSSEHVLHGELYHPGRCRGRRVGRSVRSGGAECRAEVRPGSASEGATVAEAESNAIRYVVELSADLDGLAFFDPEASGNRLIPLPECRS